MRWGRPLTGSVWASRDVRIAWIAGLVNNTGDWLMAVGAVGGALVDAAPLGVLLNAQSAIDVACAGPMALLHVRVAADTHP